MKEMLIKLGTPSEEEDEEDDDEEEEEKEEEGEREKEWKESRMRLTRSPSSLYRRRRGEQLRTQFFCKKWVRGPDLGPKKLSAIHST